MGAVDDTVDGVSLATVGSPRNSGATSCVGGLRFVPTVRVEVVVAAVGVLTRGGTAVGSGGRFNVRREDGGSGEISDATPRSPGMSDAEAILCTTVGAGFLSHTPVGNSGVCFADQMGTKDNNGQYVCVRHSRDLHTHNPLRGKFFFFW